MRLEGLSFLMRSPRHLLQPRGKALHFPLKEEVPLVELLDLRGCLPAALLLVLGLPLRLGQLVQQAGFLVS